MPPDDATQSLRDSLAAAFDSQTDAPSTPDVPSSSESMTPASAEPPPSSSADAPVIPESSERHETPSEGPVRGPDGKFQKKEGQPAVPSQAPAPPNTTQQPPTSPNATQQGQQQLAPAVEGPRAPQAWKPQTREHWSKLPVEVREEVARREAQIQTVINDNAEARDIAAQFIQTVQPYEAFIRAENSDPFKAIQYMMDTAVSLRTSPPHIKASLVADIIKQYNIDVAMLDAALVGRVAPQDPTSRHVQELLERELKPIKDMFGQFSQRAQQRQSETDARAEREVMSFAENPANEFYDDVKEVMADLMEMASRRNIPMSLKDAYDRACGMDPSISKVIEARKLQTQAQQSQEQANRARRAGSSLPSGGGAPPGGPQADTSSIRGAIEAAMSGLSET